MKNFATKQRFQSEVIQIACPVLPLTYVANVKLDENKGEWYFCCSFFVSLPFPVSLLSIM